MILCPNCRAPNPDSFRFCGRCGKPLREEKAEEGPKEEPVPSWLRELGRGLEAGPGPALHPMEKGPPAEEAALPPWLAEAPAEAPAE
ncbi:MAG: zinc ribbon domain-containing protein, partial [Chloroflexia bacterium]